MAKGNSIKWLYDKAIHKKGNYLKHAKICFGAAFIKLHCTYRQKGNLKKRSPQPIGQILSGQMRYWRRDAMQILFNFHFGTILSLLRRLQAFLS